MSGLSRLPRIGPGAFMVWLRNARVWRKSWKTSLVGSIGEPLFYFFGIGFGLGSLIPSVNGGPYLNFIAPGLIFSSVMYSATIESTYSTFTKMEHQKVYASMVLSPLSFDEIVFGEMLWAVTKGIISGGTILALAVSFGVIGPWPAVAALAVILLAGLMFSSLGMIVTSEAKSYDFFNYYFTLIISPMFFFSGIFFPLSSLGDWAERIGWFFPLTHLVGLSRALSGGGSASAGDAIWLAVFGLGVFLAAFSRMTRRFMP